MRLVLVVAFHRKNFKKVTQNPAVCCDSKKKGGKAARARALEWVQMSLSRLLTIHYYLCITYIKGTESPSFYTSNMSTNDDSFISMYVDLENVPPMEMEPIPDSK